MIVAARIQPSHVCTALIPKFSYSAAPNGRRRLKIRSRKKPATVGGRIIGSVRKPSITARTPGRSFITARAAKIPKKKDRIVATIPVLIEMTSGLQSSDCKNSSISCITFPFYPRQPCIPASRILPGFSLMQNHRPQKRNLSFSDGDFKSLLFFVGSSFYSTSVSK